MSAAPMPLRGSTGGLFMGVSLVRGETDRVAGICPYCGERHVHGLTPDMRDRRGSHRVAHCGKGAGPAAGYFLRLIERTEST